VTDYGMERSEFANYIWEQKYKAPQDATIDDSFKRVAKVLSEGDSDFESSLYEELASGRFVPAGRIFAGAGVPGKYTLFNCFVSSTIEDSMEGIFNVVKEAAITQKYGGGIGFDFSTIRPAKSKIHDSTAPASGPLSFMRVFDTMCSTVMSGNSRRGAMMGILNVSHPDILDFIKIKGSNSVIDKVEDTNTRRELYSNFGNLRNFNISVGITDTFIEAVRKDQFWDLQFDGVVYNTIAARVLWDQILNQTYKYSEPGIFFVDTVNKLNNLSYTEKIATTNPCGEQGLPSNGNCNLGAINLSRFVTNPFTTDARFDEVLLQKTVKIAVRALDNVIDVTQYPIPEQEKEGKNKRRIGLGIMGLATVFQMLGCTYGDSDSSAHTNFIMKRIANYAYAESANIAKEKGAFPLYDREAILKAPFVRNKLTTNVRDDISKYGLRNGVILTVAPTGTTALAFGDNCTSGIEPAFALSYSRNVRIGGGDEYKSYDIEDYGVRLFKHLYPGLEIPKHVMDSVTEHLTITDHLDILENVQYWIDASVSKTINVPQSYSFEDFKSVYESAYDRKCKGCTTYRPSDVRGSILSTAPAENKKETAIVPIVSVDKRPSVLDSKTYYIPAWPDDNCSRYVTIADLEDGRPWEIFIATKATTSSAETMALARIISALMRRTDDVSYIADVLSEVHSPTGGSWIDGKYIPSLPAAYGAILKRHIEKKHDIFVNKEKKTVAVKGKLCNHCGEYSLISQDGCNQCLNCGYSKCG